MFDVVLNAPQDNALSIYLLKVNNRNNRARCEIYSKSTKTPEQRHWRRSGVIIVNFEHISHLVRKFILSTFSMYLLAANVGFFSHLPSKIIEAKFYFCSVINLLAVAVLINGNGFLLRRIKVIAILRRFNQHHYFGKVF